MSAHPPGPRRPTDHLDGELSTDRWTLSAVMPRPDRVGYVRHQARLLLGLWGLTDLTAPVEVLVSELATNAVRHARTVFTVTIAWDGITLRVEVGDESPVAPRSRLTEDADREGGRGLLLVDAVAREWGVDFYRHGKCIWFTVTRDADDPW